MRIGIFGIWVLLVLSAAGLRAQEAPPAAPDGPDALATWLSTPEKDRPRPTTKEEAADALKRVQGAMAALAQKRKDEGLEKEVAEALGQLAAVLSKIEQEYTQRIQLIAEGKFSSDLDALERDLSARVAAAEPEAARESIKALQARLAVPPSISAEPGEAELAEAVEKVSEWTKKDLEAGAVLSTAETALNAARSREAALPGEVQRVIDSRTELEKKLAAATTTGYATEVIEEELWLAALQRERLDRETELIKVQLKTKFLETDRDTKQDRANEAKLRLELAKRKRDALTERRTELESRRAAEEARRDQDPRIRQLKEEQSARAAEISRATKAAATWSEYFEPEKGALSRIEHDVTAQEAQAEFRSSEVGLTTEFDQLVRERRGIAERRDVVGRDREAFVQDLGWSRSRLRVVTARVNELAADNRDGGESLVADEVEAELGRVRQALVTSYESEAAALRDLQAASAENLGRLSALATRVGQNYREIEGRIRWTREESEIDTASIETALGDFRQSLKGIRGWTGRFGVWLRDLFLDPATRTRSFLAVFLIVLGLLFFRFVQRRLPTTYHWLDERDAEEEGGRLFKILGLVLRRTNFSFFLALTFVGIPWACGLTREVIVVVAVVFATPFLYRLGRVLLDIVFAPDSPEGGLAPLDPVLARLFHRAGRYLLNLALLFVPVGILMARFGYGARNPGFVELWWLVYKTLTFAVVLFTVFRPAVLKRLIRGDGVLASSLKSWILLLYPVVVSVILFLVVLTSLRFVTAERFFRNLFLITGGLLLVAYLVYRVILRGLVNVRDIDVVHNADAFADASDFDAAQRRQFVDRTLRLILRAVFLVPVIILLREFWDPVDFGFLDTGLWGDEPPVTIRDVMKAVLALVATVVFARFLRGFVNHVIARGFGWEQGLRYTVTTLTGYSVMTLGAIVFLNTLQVKGSQIALVTSALVFGIGFGLQSIVKNFISGLILLIERPVRVGDRVEVGGNSGAVDKITLRATRVMTWEGVGIIIPNEELIGGTLVNHSLGVPRLRTTLTFGVAYGSDLSVVRETVQKIVSGHGLVLKRPGPEVFFVGFGDSSLDFQVRFWTHLDTFRLRVASDMRYAIDAAFRKAEIEIPFPQHDVNLRMVQDNGESIVVPRPEDLPSEGEGDEPGEAGATT